MFSSILAFDFNLILGLFFTFWDSNWLILGSGQGSNAVLASTYTVEQLLFSMIPSTLLNLT